MRSMLSTRLSSSYTSKWCPGSSVSTSARSSAATSSELGRLYRATDRFRPTCDAGGMSATDPLKGGEIPVASGSSKAREVECPSANSRNQNGAKGRLFLKRRITHQHPTTASLDASGQNSPCTHSSSQKGCPQIRLCVWSAKTSTQTLQRSLLFFSFPRLRISNPL